MQTASKIRAIATGWLIRLEREATPELWEELQQWLDSNPRHRAEFIRQRTAWNRCDKLKMLRPADGTIDADLLSRIEFVPDDQCEPEDETREPIATEDRGGFLHGIDLSRRGWLAAAAATGLAILGAWYYAFQTGWESYRTAVGAQQQIALSDGSTVDLNTDSEMRSRMSGAHRDIVLKRGEALFHVAHDIKRPFIVTAETTVVRAVGTAFSVRIREDSRVEVLVKDGRVLVGSPTINAADEPALTSSATPLSRGDLAAASRGRVTVKRIYPDEIGRRLAWTAGRLWFQGETLQQEVGEFNRYNVRHLSIADPSIMNMSLGGSFAATDPDSFVAALKHSFPIIAIPSQDGSELRLIAAPGAPDDDTIDPSEEPAGVSSITPHDAPGTR
jgi:transmembrane sensor